MRLYTLNKSTYIRGLLKPDPDVLKRLVVDAGNNEFEIAGLDDVGFSLVMCEHKPLDSSLYGCEWVESIPQT
jgi:hypothetical protein